MTEKSSLKLTATEKDAPAVSICGKEGRKTFPSFISDFERGFLLAQSGWHRGVLHFIPNDRTAVYLEMEFCFFTQQGRFSE